MKNTQQGFTLIELMIVVAIIAILAAIAIPQYNDYTARAQLSEAMNLAGGLKTPIATAYSEDASSASCAVPNGSVESGKYVASLAVANAADDGCDIVATMAATGVQAKVVSETVTMSYVPSTGAWTCVTSAASEIAPKACPNG